MLKLTSGIKMGKRICNFDHDVIVGASMMAYFINWCHLDICLKKDYLFQQDDTKTHYEWSTPPRLCSESLLDWHVHTVFFFCFRIRKVFFTFSLLIFLFCPFIFFPLQRPVRWTMCFSRQPQPSWRLSCGSGFCWKRPALSHSGHSFSPTFCRDPSKKQ